MPANIEAEEFYKLRDNRTDIYLRETGSYSSKTVKVSGALPAMSTYVAQVIAVVTCNLLARWCRNVQLAIPDVEMHPLLGSGTLMDRLLHLMHAADPFGAFAGIALDSPTADLNIEIGASTSAVTGAATHLAASGWLASISKGGAECLVIDSLDSNPVGAAAAAILGGAQVFREAAGLDGAYPQHLLFDAFLMEPAGSPQGVQYPVHPSVGRILLVGCGAVGSAAAYFTGLFGIEAEITAADGDVLGVENLGRSPLFAAAQCGTNKAVAMALELAANPSIKVHAVPQWWHDSSALHDLGAFDIVIPAANEHHVREALQAALPPLMIHASTSSAWQVNFGRHIPGVDDCLAERFEGMSARPKMSCSSGAVPITDGASVDASLPFLSFWAGFLISVDLLRLTLAGYPQVSNFGMHLFRKPGILVLDPPRGPRASCACRQQGGLFEQLRRDTRYRKLSPVSW